MNEDKGTGATPPEDEPRTVVNPGAGASATDGATDDEEPTAVTPAATPEDEERTVVAPAAPAAPQAAMPTGATSMPTFSNFAPRTDGQGIQIGDVLNHIFEVKRFIARGGMGEVFEGVNVNSDERVAIKVMLPALAADANVIALFRKEAKTLTKFSHDALVKYRTLAQEPQLGVLYIVTEYIDGTNVSDVLGTMKPDTDELAGLLSRLASGLSVAHSFGAIHRDISPDNVLLEEGKLNKAKVIDFGIAKDLDPSSKTIVGEGFAGKLNYVAPEQLGDFGRNIGPWTDVYSLALVILAVIKGKNVQMGGSLVDAVDKRRAGPDLSEAPEKLKPVLEAMLKADPKDRLRSMDDVLAKLAGAGMGGRTMMADGTMFAPGEARGVSKPALIGAIAAGIAILGAGAFFAMRSSGPTPEEEVQLARVAINQSMPAVECSWLDIAGLQAGEPLAIRMAGVAGNPVAARTQISQAVTTAGVTNPAVNVDDVAIIRPQGCSALQAFGQIRRSGVPQMSVSQREFELVPQPPGSEHPLLSQAIVTFRPPEGQDFALLGIEPNGELSEVLPNRAAFDEAVTGFGSLPEAERPITETGPGTYRLKIDMWHNGWSGLVLLAGDGPFDPAVARPAIDARGDEWRSNFVATASERDWKSEMLWFKSVDKQPN